MGAYKYRDFHVQLWVILSAILEWHETLLRDQTLRPIAITFTVLSWRDLGKYAPPAQRPKSTGARKSTRSKRSPKISKEQFSARIVGLIENNATDQDIEDELRRYPDQKLSFVPLIAKDAFYHAAVNQRYEIVPQLLTRQDVRPWNALHLAVAYNDDDFIVQHFGTTIPDLGYLGGDDTPLHLAVCMVKPRTCKLLLENGCWDRYTGGDRDLVGHMAMLEIHWECKPETEREWCELLKWLYTIGGNKLDAKNAKGETVDVFMRRLNIPPSIKAVIENIKGEAPEDLPLSD